MFCENADKNLYNAVSDCLRQSFNYTDKEHLKKVDKDLRLLNLIYDLRWILSTNIMHEIY